VTRTAIVRKQENDIIDIGFGGSATAFSIIKNLIGHPVRRDKSRIDGVSDKWHLIKNIFFKNVHKSSLPQCPLFPNFIFLNSQKLKNTQQTS
jgi:hypothetical protein